MKSLVAIVGPTAVGKSELAVQLARELDGEIISADSRQVYRYMDVGTAKPTRVQREVAPHHLIDIIYPDEDFNLAIFQELAYTAIRDVQSRGKLPLLVGGSGLYVWAVLEGWSIPRVPPCSEIRQELETRVSSEGIETLYRELQEVDNVAASQIDPRNTRRVIRALEVCRVTGRPFSEFRKKHPPDFNTVILGLTAERATLYHYIDSRVDRMIDNGFIEEVRGLIEWGYSLELPAMSSVGYPQIGRFLKGEVSLDETIRRIKFETHRFARHQYAWFRLTDERILWVHSGQEAVRRGTQLALDLCAQDGG